MESKTYVFGNEGNGQGGMMSLLAPLLQQRGLDPNLLLAMNKNGNGFGEGGWFMWVIFLFFLMGWGGNGWGGFGNGRGGGIANEINNDYGRSLLMDAIGGNRNALSNLATQLNCTEGQIQAAISALTSQVQSVGNQVGMSGMQTINALQQGNMQIAQQLASCCCEQRLATCQQTNTLQGAINNVATGQERGFSSVAFETQRQTCDLQKSIANATAEIKAGQTAAEFRELQNKIDRLREENSTFKSSAMTSQIVGQAVAPINSVLAGLQKEVNEIKCAQPNTVTVPYQPFVTVPNCVAAQYGLYGVNGANSFWG
nr:MAG TPA: GTPase-activating protein [Caudoviricetes sp.]